MEEKQTTVEQSSSPDPQDRSPAVQKASLRRQWLVKRRRPLAVAVVIILGALAGFFGSWVHDYFANETSSLTVLKTAKEDGNNTVTPNEESIAAVANAVSPSVVSILSSSTQSSRFYGQQTQESAGT